MLLHVPAVLSREQLAECRRLFGRAEWVDGRSSALGAVAKVKHNKEIPGTHPVARDLGKAIMEAVYANPLFVTRALPMRICPPLFNRYEGGGTYGSHTDSGLFQMPSGGPMRGDLSATLFLTPPEDYDGGELIIEDTYGQQSIKLPAGDMIVYPASSLHYVSPVTRGARISSFFWIQSAIREDSKRAVLADIDAALEDFNRIAPDNPGIMRLHGVYNNLLRLWSET
jgi:PKHD-type hydroxylase